MARENRLARETSPYLLQHAHNPVDWYPWGPEALARARAEEKPILLSIGYAACHWCHVMERESFENDEIAAFMNENFVCIKVDREERPDLDDVYMAATVAMSGAGGWPMTVFLTPEQEPFFAGTYFPPTDRYGRPGFVTVLAKLAELWDTDRDALFAQARQLADHVRAQSQATPPGPLSAESIEAAVRQLGKSYEPRYGGFGKAPKFPPHQSLRLLLRFHRRTGDAEAEKLLRGTLDGMKNGGIYDHVGGGFARYSTDERWHVPHFEKMLYDNAQLALAYAEAFQHLGEAEYGRVARETLDYVAREMQGTEGGYFSATDADSEGVEGKFFVWSQAEVLELLGPEAGDHFCQYYDVRPDGNWEGHNVLWTPRPLARVAAELGMLPEALTSELERSRSVLYRARQERVPPLLDDKILTAWNGLMIEAMAFGHRVFPGRGYLESASRAADFLLDRLRSPDGRLLRTYRAGKQHLAAYLEDYAFLINGLIGLFEAGGAERYLREALALADQMTRDFGDPDGAFFHTAHGHEALITRIREGHDGAIPNANAAATLALFRLSRHFDRADLELYGRVALGAYAVPIERLPRAFGTALIALDFVTEAPLELVLVGRPGSADYDALAAVLAAKFLPNRIEARVPPGHASDLPLVAGKEAVGGRAALYVCQNFVCAAPVTEAAAAVAALRTATATR